MNLKRGDELGVERAGVERLEVVDDDGELVGEAWKDWPDGETHEVGTLGAVVDWSDPSDPKVDADRYFTMTNYGPMAPTSFNSLPFKRNQLGTCRFETLSVMQMSNHFNALTGE